MSELVTELHIVGDNKNIFDTEMNYIIPLYQRAFEQWKDGVNQFGNLCIVQRNVNSKFSNMSPEAKKSTFKEMISKGSIKLRIMSELTEKGEDKVASLYWKDTLYKEHESDMIKMLCTACYQEE